MPDNPCPRCKKVGLVRQELVIKAEKTERHYYCDACDSSWQVTDDGKSVTAPYELPPEK